jgi:hypothetical protein
MKKNKVPYVERHLTHPAEVRPGRAHNAAQLYCLKCGKHIKWLSRAEYKIVQKQV